MSVVWKFSRNIEENTDIYVLNAAVYVYLCTERIDICVNCEPVLHLPARLRPKSEA